MVALSEGEITKITIKLFKCTNLINVSGLNDGVMLMDLEKMRQFGWKDYIKNYSKQCHSKIFMGGQDVINIFFRFHPGPYLH